MNVQWKRMCSNTRGTHCRRQTRLVGRGYIHISMFTDYHIRIDQSLSFIHVVKIFSLYFKISLFHHYFHHYFKIFSLANILRGPACYRKFVFKLYFNFTPNRWPEHTKFVPNLHTKYVPFWSQKISIKHYKDGRWTGANAWYCIKSKK
jgi:hypothetical protein